MTGTIVSLLPVSPLTILEESLGSRQPLGGVKRFLNRLVSRSEEVGKVGVMEDRVIAALHSFSEAEEVFKGSAYPPTLVWV